MLLRLPPVLLTNPYLEKVCPKLRLYLCPVVGPSGHPYAGLGTVPIATCPRLVKVARLKFYFITSGVLCALLLPCPITGFVIKFIFTILILDHHPMEWKCMNPIAKIQSILVSY